MIEVKIHNETNLCFHQKLLFLIRVQYNWFASVQKAFKVDFLRVDDQDVRRFLVKGK